MEVARAGQLRSAGKVRRRGHGAPWQGWVVLGASGSPVCVHPPPCHRAGAGLGMCVRACVHGAIIDEINAWHWPSV